MDLERIELGSRLFAEVLQITVLAIKGNDLKGNNSKIRLVLLNGLIFKLKILIYLDTVYIHFNVTVIYELKTTAAIFSFAIVSVNSR